VPGDRFKSSAKVIHTLIEIVAKGGSLLLGIGPKPDGTLPDEAVERLKEIGKWMDKNKEAIYNTRAVKNYHDGSTFFTKNKKQPTMYALVTAKENEAIPATVSWKGNLPATGTKMIFIETGVSVKWKKTGDSVTVTLPKSFMKSTANTAALTFAFTPAD
jgi:alpha-L-fucosidase